MPRSSQKRVESTVDTTAEVAALAPGLAEGAEGVTKLSDIMNEINGFRNETAGNFQALRKEVSDVKENTEKLQMRMNEAEQRIAQNEDRDIELTKVLFHTMRKQKQLEDKCEDLESRERRNNLRIYSVP